MNILTEVVRRYVSLVVAMLAVKQQHFLLTSLILSMPYKKQKVQLLMYTELGREENQGTVNYMDILIKRALVRICICAYARQVHVHVCTCLPAGDVGCPLFSSLWYWSKCECVGSGGCAVPELPCDGGSGAPVACDRWLLEISPPIGTDCVVPSFFGG